MSNGNAAQDIAPDLSQQQRADIEIHLLHRRSYVQTGLTIGITVAFFTMLGLLLFHQVPSNSEDMFDIMLGALQTAFTVVISFWFQSAMQRSQQTRNGSNVVAINSKTVDTPKV